MSPLEPLWRLRSAAGRLVIVCEALLCLGVAHFLTRLVPFRWWRGWLGPIGRLRALPVSPRERGVARHVRRALHTALARAPFRAVCLPQALAARWMLARRGIASELHLGARQAEDAPAPGRAYQLHAWLYCGDIAICGTGSRDQYAAFN